MNDNPTDARLARGSVPRVIVATEPELAALIREAVRAELRVGQQIGADVLSTEQVAELLHVSPRSVPKMVTRDGLPTLGKVGRGYRFRRPDVLAWLEQRVSAPGKHSTLNVERLRRARGVQ